MSLHSGTFKNFNTRDIMCNKKRRLKRLSPFWLYLKASGCHWERSGKFTDIYGNVNFDAESGKWLRIPANLRFHGKVKVTQTNKLSPNIVFQDNFYILPIAVGSIDVGKSPRIRIPRSTQFMSSVFLNTYHGKWPNNIRFIRKHFFWTYSYIRQLPDIFSVTGEMNLSGSKIKHFPAELKVNSDAIMLGITAKKLPDIMTLNNSLRLSFSTLK
ncbi:MULTISPECIES: hypothetical protein [Brenneria]|nr:MULTISPECIES: hypothetical protein [Brenneria]EHD22812.1 hypothetical protein BrE312_3452 [Brenneria sp. EniD312]QCR05781.1 hypothetical protein EH206_17300 [Brenneria nigrifluens DSM 30175 = ATCC 13028]